jgi:hypothetical protein
LDKEEGLFDMDELIDFSHDEPEDWDDHMVDLEETPLEAPIAYQNTQHLKSQLAGADVLLKVKKVINCMQNKGLNLPLFLLQNTVQTPAL